VSDAATADGASPNDADYTQYTHQQLYDWLRAGDPGQVHGLHAGWLSMAHDAASLGRQLARDLGRLQWDGPAGDEFRSRIGAIGSFSAALGQGFEPLAEAVFVMAGDLTSARSEAVPPAATSVVDAAALGLPQLSLLPQVAKDNKAEAAGRSKMVQLVTSLAESYQATSYSRIVPPSDPPPALPTHSNGTTATDGSGPTSGYQATRFLSGSGAGYTTPPTGTYTGPGQPPTLTYPHQPVTTLAGVGPVTALPTGGLTAPPVTAGLSAGPGGFGTGLVAAMGVPGGNTTELGAGPRRPGMRAAEGELVEPANGTRGITGTRDTDHTDNPAEYTTWLTDDLMIWADPLDLPPAVLGERPAS
jgi:hypothetical protein